MERIVRRAIRKLETEYDGSYVGYITSQDLLHLVKLGMFLESHHKSRVDSARRDKKAGDCFSNWQYFIKPKKLVIEILNQYLEPEED